MVLYYSRDSNSGVLILELIVVELATQSPTVIVTSNVWKLLAVDPWTLNSIVKVVVEFGFV